MADSDATVPISAASPPFRDGQMEETRTPHAHIEAASVRGSEPTAAFAPSGPTGSREFLAERLGRPVRRKLESVVLSCLEKDPARRPQTAQALSARLAACDDVEPWEAEGARKWWSRRRTA